MALYIRRSTNERLQAESLETQEEILRNYAAANSCAVVRVYSDSASGRSTRGRSDFMTLIDDVRSGACGYEAVLVRDVSRWGRFENVDEN